MFEIYTLPIWDQRTIDNLTMTKNIWFECRGDDDAFWEMWENVDDKNIVYLAVTITVEKAK